MSVRRDPRTGRWYFRARATLPDGKRVRIYGTPGVSGPWHDLPPTKVGAQEAERRAIATAMTGAIVRAEHQEVPTIRAYSTVFFDVYSASHKPSTRRDKRQRLDAYLLPVLGDLRLDELRQHHVDALVADLLARATANGRSGRKSVNNTLGVLSALVRYAVTNRIIADPDLSFSIAAQRTELEAVDAGDVDRLVAAATDPRYRVAILLCADAGLRIGEARALPWLEVNELGREIAVAWSYDRAGALTETKGWERRTVPISDRLWSALREVDRRGPLVFARRDGKPLGYDGARAEIHEIYLRAEVTPRRQPWHALRHTFGTELAARGAPVHVIQRLMGHKSIETTLRYMHVDRDAKRAAIARLSVSPAGSGWAADGKTTRK